MKIKLLIISLVLTILFIFSFLPYIGPKAVAEGQSGGQESKAKEEKSENQETGSDKGEAVKSDKGEQGSSEQKAGGDEVKTANSQGSDGEGGGSDQSSDDANISGESENESSSALEGFDDDIKLLGDQLHKEYGELLDSYVDEDGNVDYLTLRRHRIDIYSISRLFAGLHQAEYFSWEKDQKIAFWINAYNLYTIRLVIENYPIEPKWYNKIVYPDNSIIHISGAWDRHYFTVMGLDYSLKEIEREILLEKFTNPKIFFALSYATMGGAYLRNEPYRGQVLDEQLTEQVKKYLNSERGVQLEPGDNIIRLSDIFNWYTKAFAEYEKIRRFRTFKPKERAYLNFLWEYGNEDIRDFLQNRDFEVRYIRYDWHLNEQKK